ncbi:MAG: MGMT family protein [Oscillatoriales cyanobacterium C42_A2020_001]|nr:MGMT family protein [Leptolyngbyaceae cyanobacterium C42_A2020_001]
MNVQRLFIKPQAGMPVQAQQELVLTQGWGIQADASAQVGSPRQILIADRATLKQFDLQPGDLRENILLDGRVAKWQSGQVLQVGQALIRLTFLCEPCAYLNTLQPGFAKHLKTQRGWLGMVVQSGAIAVGDRASLTSYQFPALPDDPRGRFYEFVARIPAGRVVSTKDVILAIGATPSHYRVIPNFIQHALIGLPVHRVVAIDGSLLLKHLPNQAQQLADEGVNLHEGKVCAQAYLPREQFHATELP